MSVAILLNHSKRGLPSAYKQVEFIASTGTEYINTGVSLANGFRIIADMDFKQQSSIFRSYFWTQNSASPWGNVGAREHNPIGTVGISAGAGGASTTIAHGRNTLELKAQNGTSSISVNGSVVASGSYPTGITSYPLYIFAENTANSAISDRRATTKLYSFKIYDGNDTLVRNYIPCYRKADGVAGLYDLVTRSFFTNAGSGYFLYEDDLQEVEYIQSSGTQHIDTGFIPDNNTRIICDILWTEFNNSYYGGFGAAQSYNSRAYECYVWASYVNWNFYSNTYGADGGLGYQGTANTRYHIDANKNVFVISNASGTPLKTIRATDGTFTAPYTMYLFGTHRSSSGHAKCRFYGHTYIYDNGTLVREFVPCYRKSNGVIGMWDKVNKDFYTNGGSGTFTKGSDVT